MEIRGDSLILQEVRDVPWAYVALPRRQWAGFSRRLPKAIAGVAFVEAAAALGATQKYNDFNGAIQEAGAGFYQSTKTTDGVRASTASAFIRPILGRKNLQLLSQVRATRLVFEKAHVRGVEYSGPEGLQTIGTEREVALCCGAFETPKLMMLSGLGPADQRQCMTSRWCKTCRA